MWFEMASTNCLHVVVDIVNRYESLNESWKRIRSEDTTVVGQVLAGKGSVIAIVMVKRDVSASDTTRAKSR